MNSSQLLNSLNKQSHNKHNKSRSKSVLIMETINEKPQQSILSKDNQFTDVKILPQQLASPPGFLVEILKQQQKSRMFRNKKLTQEVLKMCKQKQKNVFLAYNDSHLAYLSELKDLSKNKNELISNCINDVMMRRYNMVTGDLENGKIFINHDRSIISKEQLEKLQEIDRARLLKIKQGAIRSKLDLLHIKMEQMELINMSPKNNESIQAINKKIQENLDQASYGLQSQKTKIARDYVKYMAQQRKQRRKREQLREERKQKIEQQREIQLKQAQQVKDLSKKQQILQKIQLKRRKRQEQQKMIAQKEQKIEQFLQKYKDQMPVYKKKQKQFEQKYVKPQKAYREQRLKQIKQKKKSYSLNDIVDHQKKYQQIKKKQIQRKLYEKQLQAKSLKLNTKQYYRGSIHKYVQQVDKRNKQKDYYLYELGKNRYQRMVGYAKQIKQDFKPKVDQNKRSELLKLLQFQQMEKGGFQKKYKPIYNQNGEDVGVQSFYEEIPKKNRYQQGNKYMEQGNLRRRKNISQSVQVSSQAQNEKLDQKQESLKLLQKKSSIKWVNPQQNEKEIWKLRSKQMAQMSNNLSSPKQFEQVKINFENLDKKAADKQKLMKHAKMSVQQFIQQKGALDNFYLESIKNKMRLLQ